MKYTFTIGVSTDLQCKAVIQILKDTDVIFTLDDTYKDYQQIVITADAIVIRDIIQKTKHIVLSSNG